MRFPRAVASIGLVVVVALLPAAPASGATTSSRLKRQLSALLAAEGGPPGVIVTIRRGGHTKVLSRGRGLIGSNRRPRYRDHMRLASVRSVQPQAPEDEAAQEARVGAARHPLRDQPDQDDTVGN